MTGTIDCQIFGDQLDSLKRGALPDEMVELLFHHAESCPDCATLLGMVERLSGMSAPELEASVPDSLVRGMWPRVDAQISAERGARTTARTGFLARMVGGGARWLVPAQAVAIVVMLVGGGALLGTIEKVRHREDILLERLKAQEQRLSELDRRVKTTNAGRLVGWGERSFLRRAVGDVEDLTVAEILEFLRSVPGDTQILSPSEADRLRRRMERDWATAQSAAWRDIVTSDGLQADEALALLSEMELPSGDPGAVRWLRSFARNYDL